MVKGNIHVETFNFLAGTKSFVDENLTPINETIACNYRKLKRSGFIHACYSRNGIVHMKETETSKPVLCGQTFFCFLIVSKIMMKMINIIMFQ